MLVVDDDSAIREVVADILRCEGYCVASAVNGAEALQIVEQADPALVLLDMQMPVLNGWEFAERLRQRGIRLPIVVMTAARDAHRWCREIGGDDCLPKPFELDVLLDLVQRYCASHTG